MLVQYTADGSDVSMVHPTCSSSDDSPADPASLPPLRLRFTVFFDGTGNNMFNTQTRLEHNTARDDSFRNDYSNIAKLANYINTPGGTNNFHIPVYVEGMGTEHGATDDVNGMAFGTGERGIVDRVNSAMQQIAREIARLSASSNRTVDELKIDSFGFSRGAAAARHFLHRIYNGPQHLLWHIEMNRVHVNNLVIPFVGLFDSVASFRSYGLLGPTGSIEDDTYELHLNAFDEAQKITHIIASDEFRMNFPVTNIASAGGKGTTIHVPGVHSDVGGGYNSVSEGDMHENNLPILRIPFQIEDGWDVIRPIQQRFAAEIDRLVNLGWYSRQEFIVQGGYDPEATNSILSYDPLCVNRTGIRNSYPRIPLKIMASEASGAGLSFLPTLDSENELSGILATAYGYINGNRGRTAAQWNTDMNPMMLTLRHEYFHFSSHYTPTAGVFHPMNSQFHSSAYQWEDSDRNIIAGVRRRKVLAG